MNTFLSADKYVCCYFNKLTNMKKTLLLLLLPLLVITSCETNNEAPIDNQKKIKVKSFIYPNYETIINYGPNGYSTGNYSEIEGKEYKVEIVYEGNNIMYARGYRDSELQYETEYTYADNLIIKEENHAVKPVGYEVKERLFTYDSDKNLVKVVSTDFSGESWIETITYKDGNRKSVTEKMAGQSDDQAYTMIFKYDDKNNYTRTMYPDNYLKIIFAGKNNLTEEPVRIETTYEYNSDDYPIKVTKYNNSSYITYFYE